MYITKKQIKKLKENYESNKINLVSVENFIYKNGATEDGLCDVSESFEQGYNNALEFVFNTLGIEFREKPKETNENYDIEEICGICDYPNKIKWDGKSRTTICQCCGEEILLCSLCDYDEDEYDCNNCPYSY